MRRLVVAEVGALYLVLLVASTVFVPFPARAAPDVDYIVIVDAPGGGGSWVASRDYQFGDTDTFWAAGYNNTSGYVADVPVYWYTNNTPPSWAGVLWRNTSYGPSIEVHAAGYGTARVWAYDYELNRTALQNETGPLHVSVDNVDSVIVSSDRGGLGTWVGPTTYEVGDRDTFYAAAYNNTQGFLGDIFSNWTSSNTSVGYVDSSSGNGTCPNPGAGGCYPLAYFYPLAFGYTYVTAEPPGTSLSNTTGKLTVTGIGIDDLLIRDAPNGGGTVLGIRTYFTSEQDTFYAASYNRTLGYRGDIVGDWSSNNTAVCEVRGYIGNQAHGSSVQVLLKSPGVCTVTVTANPPSGTISNTTGNLTVNVRTTVTVDDGGTADFTKIQDAVDFAQTGFRVYVFNGTYRENVVVSKELEIEGEARGTVILDGGGFDGIRLAADRIVLHRMTIQNAHVGVLNDRTNNTRVYDNVIRDYTTGLFNEHTLNAWVVYNLITRGHIGVLTNESYDDAIRWNEISFNDVFGAKSYNSRLRNCFNWNTLHDNKVGYFHDPTTEYPPMEFDGNTLADNEIGVRVENASSVRLTNNSFTGGSTGVQLLNSSAEVHANAFAGVDVGIQCAASRSNITANLIVAQVGIACDGGAPRIEGNDIVAASGDAMTLTNLDGAVVRGNDAHGGTIRIVDSHLAVLEAVDSVVILQDSTADSVLLDVSSILEVRWTIRVRAADPNGVGLGGFTVTVRDTRGTLAFSGATGADGFTPPFEVLAEVRTTGVVDSRNPFTFEVIGNGARASLVREIAGPVDVVVTVAAPASPVAIVLLLVALATSGSLAAAFSVERSRYALLTILIPLYTRLSRDKVLESYNRGRVYQYVALNPGAHFNGIRAALTMNNGALVYHLEVLQREGLLRSRHEGVYRRFYTEDAEMPPVLENGTTEAQVRVLRAIEEMPGITQKELARILGLRQSTLAYQTDRLAAMGYITGERRGRHVAYTAKKGRT